VTENAVANVLCWLSDGVQWIDFESLAVLDAVVPDLEDARVVLITTARPDCATRGKRSAHAASRALLTSRLHPICVLLLRSTRCAVHARYPSRESDVIRSARGAGRSGVESGGLCEVEGGVALASAGCSGGWAGH